MLKPFEQYRIDAERTHVEICNRFKWDEINRDWWGVGCTDLWLCSSFVPSMLDLDADEND